MCVNRKRERPFAFIFSQQFDSEISISTGKFSGDFSRQRQLVPRHLVGVALARRADPSPLLAFAARAVSLSRMEDAHAQAVADALEYEAVHGRAPPPPPPVPLGLHLAARASKSSGDSALAAGAGGGAGSGAPSSAGLLDAASLGLNAAAGRPEFDRLVSDADRETFHVRFGMDATQLPALAEAARLGWEPVDVLARNPRDGRLHVVYRHDLRSAEIRDDTRTFWRANPMAGGVDAQYLSIARRMFPRAPPHSGPAAVPYWASGMMAKANVIVSAATHARALSTSAAAHAHAQQQTQGAHTQSGGGEKPEGAAAAAAARLKAAKAKGATPSAQTGGNNQTNKPNAVAVAVAVAAFSKPSSSSSSSSSGASSKASKSAAVQSSKEPPEVWKPANPFTAMTFPPTS